VAQVYARVAEAITRPGFIFHSAVDVKQEAGEYSYVGTTEFWLDATRDLLRVKYQVRFLADGSSLTEENVIAGGASYSPPESKAKALTCHGASPSLSALLCPRGALQKEPEDRVERGEYNGNTAVMVVNPVEISGSDQEFRFTRRLYLDPKTFLPIAIEDEGTVDYGQVVPLHTIQRYDSDFLPTNSLTAGLFEPTSIGYMQRDPEAPLRASDPGITVYWLGREFPGAGELPPLTLQEVYVPEVYPPKPGQTGPTTGGPGYKMLISYRLSNDEFGPRVLSLHVWSAPDWEASLQQSRGGNSWDQPCWEKKEVALPNGRATVFTGEGCPEEPSEPGRRAGALAHVYFPGTVVMVAPTAGYCDAICCKSKPYNTNRWWRR